MNNTILIVDDDREVQRLVSQSMTKAGFVVFSAESGEAALMVAQERKPILVVMEIVLPGISGFEVFKRLKAVPATADIDVMMLTRRHEEVDKIVALELGADDYVTKPFNPREVVLRAKAILKRRLGPVWSKRIISIGSLELDRDLCRAQVCGVDIGLTGTEFKLLDILLDSPAQIHSRESLLSEVWGYASSTETRVVDANMRRLRNKLASAGDLIVFVRGFGYRINGK